MDMDARKAASISRLERHFAALIEPHLASLRRAALRLCREMCSAEDLVQEVCLRAFKSRDSLSSKQSVRAWLLRVQFNLFVDRRRRQADTEAFDEQNPLYTDATANQPQADAVRDQRIEALNRVWSELNADQQALLAYFAEGYALAEIVEITGLPLSALKARLHRARVRLGKLLADSEHAAPATVRTGERQ
jgi:RNA polymerase sigma-70 factor (ECF subfamily)